MGNLKLGDNLIITDIKSGFYKGQKRIVNLRGDSVDLKMLSNKEIEDYVERFNACRNKESLIEYLKEKNKEVYDDAKFKIFLKPNFEKDEFTLEELKKMHQGFNVLTKNLLSGTEVLKVKVKSFRGIVEEYEKIITHSYKRVGDKDLFKYESTKENNNDREDIEQSLNRSYEERIQDLENYIKFNSNRENLNKGNFCIVLIRDFEKFIDCSFEVTMNEGDSPDVRYGKMSFLKEDFQKFLDNPDTKRKIVESIEKSISGIKNQGGPSIFIYALFENIHSDINSAKIDEKDRRDLFGKLNEASKLN